MGPTLSTGSPDPEEDYETIHGGTTQLRERQPNYEVPVNNLREVETRGTIGSLHPGILNPGWGGAAQ